MTEYRIVAKLDPQTAAGSNKVKQDLRGVQQEAKATEAALNRSFDQGRFEATIGGLITRLEQLDKSIAGLAGDQTRLTRSNETLGASLDRMAGAAARGSAAVSEGGKESGEAAGKANQLEAALRRVLAATDAEAAEQLRLNSLLREAKTLLDSNLISQTQYDRVLKMTQATGKDVVAVTGAQRIGMQQLGFQLGDVATMWSLGAKPAQIFASQIGQVTQALQLMSGGANKFINFMGGPWGIGISLALIVLAPFVGKLLEGNNALDDAVDKLRKDAEETEINRKAKERWRTSEEGLTAAVRDRIAALKESAEQTRTQGERDNILAQQQLQLANNTRQATKALLDKALAEQRVNNTTSFGGVAGTGSYIQGQADRRVIELQRLQAENDAAIADGQNLLNRSRAELSDEAAARDSTVAGRVGKPYDDQIAAIRRVRDAEKELTLAEASSYATRIRHLEELKRAEIERAEAAERAAKSTNDGVARFRTRQQAVGIAGRELQSAGFKVSENEQFGGVSGNHPGMGNAAHGKFAIDVNAPGGVVEANVPDLKARFDAMARRYQARGYRVLWNGNVYEAGGNGPTRKIPAGQNPHHDHMHLEAPTSIVGKATGASTEAQEAREDRIDAQVQERASDFVQSIVDKQSSEGVGADQQSQLNAKINEALAEFNRRFDREATEGEKATITKAFTDADARETARRFDEAYVEPLKRLQALQGKTGIDRAVLNAQLEETKRLGRELTPIEKEQIENGIRRSDQLQREAQLLEQIRGPMDAYRAQIAALNGLLKEGSINQDEFNARVASLGAELNAQAAGAALGGLQGIDPGTGRDYEDVGAIAEENLRYAKQLEAFQTYREQLIAMGVDYDAAEEAAAQLHADKLRAIDQARKDQQLGAAQEIFGSLTSIAADMFGKQSGIYRAMFAMEKAVAIARSIIAIQTGIAQASALPFPANLGAIASVIAATASIVSNIRAVTIGGYKDGGYITGPGGPRDDKIPVMVSNKEFIVNAASTAKHRDLLEAINDDRPLPVARAGDATLQFRNGGYVAGGGYVMPRFADGGEVDATAAKGGTDPTKPPEPQTDNVLLGRIAEATEHMAKLMDDERKREKKKSIVGALVGGLTGGVVGAVAGYFGVGHEDGGWTGDVGTKSKAGFVHGQEFVVKAPFAKHNRPLLEAINSGRSVRQAEAAHRAEGRTAAAPAAPLVIPPPAVGLRIINVDDPSKIADYFSTPEGDQTFINLVTRHSDVIARSTSGGIG